jgi:hypothetical protein
MYKFKLDAGQTIEYPRSEVKKVAQRIGLDLLHDAEKYEWFLRHALASLLPAEWRKEKDPTGVTQFHNTKTLVTSQVHPLTFKFRSAFMRLVKREAIKEQPDITDVDVRELLKKENIKSRRLGTNVDINILSVEEQLKAFDELVHKKSSYEVADPDKERQVMYEVDEYYQLLFEGWEVSPPDYILYSTDYLQADPMAVYAASKLLGVKEYSYLWVARLLLALPLPPLWKKIRDTHGGLVYINIEHDVPVSHHPALSQVQELMGKIAQRANCNETVIDFYDKKYNKLTVDAVALFRGVLRVVRASQQPDIEVLNKVRQKNAKISVEDSLNDVMALELARIAGVDLGTQTHLLNFVFMFLDSMRDQQKFKGWEFRFTVEGKKYWYHPETKRSSFEFPFRKALESYLARAQQQLKQTFKQKLRETSSMHYLFDFHGDELYTKARTMARRVMQSWMDRHFEDSDEEIEAFDANELLEYTDSDNPHQQIVDLMFACPFQFDELKSAMLQIDGNVDSDSDVSSNEPESQSDEQDYEYIELGKMTDSPQFLIPKKTAKPKMYSSLMPPTEAYRGMVAQSAQEPSSMLTPRSNELQPTLVAEAPELLELPDKPIVLEVPNVPQLKVLEVPNVPQPKEEFIINKFEMLSLYKTSSSEDLGKLKAALKDRSKPNSQRQSSELGVAEKPNLQTSRSQREVSNVDRHPPQPNVHRTRTFPNITETTEKEPLEAREEQQVAKTPLIAVDTIVTASMKVVMERLHISSSSFGGDIFQDDRHRSASSLNEAKLQQIHQERRDELLANISPQKAHNFDSRRANSSNVIPSSDEDLAFAPQKVTLENTKKPNPMAQSRSLTNLPHQLDIFGKSVAESAKSKIVDSRLPLGQAIAESFIGSRASSPLGATSFIEYEDAEDNDLKTAISYFEEVSKKLEQLEAEQDEGKAAVTRRKESEMVMQAIVEESSPDDLMNTTQDGRLPMRHRYHAAGLNLDLMASSLMRSRMNSLHLGRSPSETSIPSRTFSSEGVATQSKEDAAMQSRGDSAMQLRGDSAMQLRGDSAKLSRGDTAMQSRGDSAELSRGDTSELSKGDTAELSRGDAAELSRGDAAELSRGDAAELSRGDAARQSRDDAAELSRGDAARQSRGDAAELSRGDAARQSRGDPAELPREDVATQSGENGRKLSIKTDYSAGQAAVRLPSLTPTHRSVERTMVRISPRPPTDLDVRSPRMSELEVVQNLMLSSRSAEKLPSLKQALTKEPRSEAKLTKRGHKAILKPSKEFVIPIEARRSEDHEGTFQKKKLGAVYHDSALNEANFVHYLQYVGNPGLKRKSLARFECPKAVTPIHVYAMAKRLNIKVSVQSHSSVESDLMWVAHLQLLAPPPGDFAVPLDIEALLALKLFEHPGDEYFLLMLKSHRQKRNKYLKTLPVKGRTRDLVMNSWLQFKNSKGATYYFNFLNQTTSTSYPGFYSSLGSIL